MAIEWREYTIGEIADIIGGSTPSTSDPDNFNGDIPWLTPKDLSGPHDRYISRGERNLSRKGLASCSAQLLPSGAVLLSSRAPVGYVAIAKNPVATNQGFRSLVLKPGFEPEFVYYWLKANVDELERHASGSTFKELSGLALAQITIRLPDHRTQRAIAHILGTLDDKIELNRRMNATLEAIARAIFKSWFVDFDPVHAKARGEQPYGMDADTAALFPDAFEDSELGPIPAGWRVTTLSKTVEVVKGRSYKSSEIEQSNVALVTLKSINRGGGYNPQGLKPYTGKYRPEQIVSPGEIVVAFTDITQQAEVIGKPALVRGHPDYDSLIASLDLGIVRPMIVGMNIPYLYELLSTDGFQAHVLSYVNGSTVLHLNNRGIPSYRYPLPTPAVLAKFEALAQPLFDRISANEAESRTLAELRDTLLPKLILGDIRIGECNDATSS